jgi:hypothetical protein
LVVDTRARRDWRERKAETTHSEEEKAKQQGREEVMKVLEEGEVGEGEDPVYPVRIRWCWSRTCICPSSDMGKCSRGTT